MLQQFKCEFGGRELIIETGKLAKQAGGSVTVRSGDTLVLVTATSSKDAKEGIDFLPLTVEYLEKSFAAGKIPGGFFKREGRPTETAILTSRFIDRPIRPLFPENYYYDTQVITTVLSADPANNPDTLAIIGASAALVLSDIPLQKPIAGCRVGRINGQFILNPSLDQMEESDLEIVVASSHDAVVMVEGSAHMLPEEVIIEAIQFAHQSLQPIIELQNQMLAHAKPKRVLAEPVKNGAITAGVKSKKADVQAALQIKEKHERYDRLSAIKSELVQTLITAESTSADQLQLAQDFETLKSDVMRASILDQKTRIDGRGLADIRHISCETGLLPRAHGSALFTRGETQALVVATLGSAEDKTSIDGLLGKYQKNFVLHYNFPAFSVGEVKPLRSPGRREIGHGHLAENALVQVIPTEADFGYSIRIVSEILESNGSSSMASVCGGSMAMMDAGVPLKAPVAGIAMGLIKEGEKIAILSDILGDEDHLGDMDFKVTGTASGVTAIQMDIKIDGVTFDIMKNALSQAKEGRLHILKCMEEGITTHREVLHATAPKIHTMKIDTDKIRNVIGSGGKNIKSIVDQTGVKMDIQDDGTVKIFSADQNAIEQAILLVKTFVGDVEVGKIYAGVVKKIMDFGAFVEILPKTEALLHVSQIKNERVDKVTDHLKEGDKIMVKVYSKEANGKYKLTMKDVPQE